MPGTGPSSPVGRSKWLDCSRRRTTRSCWRSAVATRDRQAPAPFLDINPPRLITGTDFRVDGGALAKYWPYIPAEDKAGPLPLIRMDVTEEE
jgi:hypothetical protein